MQDGLALHGDCLPEYCFCSSDDGPE